MLEIQNDAWEEVDKETKTKTQKKYTPVENPAGDK